VINILNLSTTHFISNIDVTVEMTLRFFSDEDLFLCFEFCSTSYLGTHTRRQRRDYTKQIFDFYNENFPGISIYQDKNFKNAMDPDLFVAPNDRSENNCSVWLRTVQF